MSWLLGGVAGTLGGLLRLLPLGMGLAVGRAVGWCVYHLVGVRVAEVKERLDAALGDGGARLAPAVYAHLGMSLVELLRLGDADQLHGWVEVQGREHFQRAAALGQGVLVLTAHLGNWDLLACSQALSGVPLTVITRHVRSRGIDRVWKRKRERLGVRQVGVDSRASARQVLRALRAGGTVGFVLDQHAGSDGVVVDFFGMPAATHTGLARLAMVSGAPVVPVFAHRLPDGRHRVEALPAVPLAQGASREETLVRSTARFAGVVEQAIRRHPEQWLWLHRRWKVHGRWS